MEKKTNINNDNSIGERLSLLLDKEKVTSYDISRDTELSESTITRILNGKTSKPSKKTCKILAEYLGIDAEWLLKGSNSMQTGRMINNSIVNSKIKAESFKQEQKKSDKKDDTNISELIRFFERQLVVKDKQIEEKDKQLNKLIDKVLK